MPDSPRPARTWPRAQRLDAHRMADAVRELTGQELHVEGPCAGGQVGAAYVRWPHGRRSVLKWRPHAGLAALRAGPLAVCAALRSAGYPAPATELAVQAGDAVVIVQELLPGSALESVGHGALDRILELNATQAGALAAHRTVPPAALHLRTDGAGFCLHEPLRQLGRHGAALDDWIRAVGDTHGDHLPGDDAVHYDFQPANLLARGGRLTGVVDWDGAARGDHRFDLVTLRFGLHATRTEPDVAARLDAVLDTLPEDVLRPAWAHMSLRMTDWSVRHFTRADTEHWLELAQRRAGT